MRGKVIIIILGFFLAWTAIALLLTDGVTAEGSAPNQHQGSPGASNDLPDLVIESLILDPPDPRIYEPATITVTVRNQGNASAPGVRLYLYIDPSDRPPISTTQETHPFLYAVIFPPGASVTFAYVNFTFSQAGCDHAVYAWADPLERIDESDESNNLKDITVCVERDIPPGADSYEPDDTCNQAGEIPTDGTVQTHNFDPQGDVDWVKFKATVGVTYTIAAAGTGQQAHPAFELWDSCNVPPDSFGTSSRLVFPAPASGWYYLRLENEQDDYDPDKSSYQLTIQAEATGVQPYVIGVNPDWGYNDRNTNVVITGTNFGFPPLVEMCPYQNGTCEDCTQLLKNASWINSQRLYAVVPANLADGEYCLAVTNPGGKVGMLPGAFTVLPGQPDLREVRPTQGYADLPTDLHVYGFNLHPGISVTLGSTDLENVAVVNQTHLRAMVPAGLPAGPYTTTAFYGAGDAGALPNAYTVLLPQDDLFAQTQELWVDPVAPRAGEVARLGLLVHRQGGSSTLSQVLVRFFANGQTLGDVHVPSLSPDGEGSTRRLDWVPTQAGDYQITAVIDPEGQIPEASEANNTVTRTVTVLATAPDMLAPHVDSLVIEGGRDVVTDTMVHLAATATDYPQPGGEGVSHLRYIEFEYSQGARLWVPVQDSGWVVSDTVNSTNYRWLLTPVGGLHYIQAWAKDGVGNISHYPYQQGISYLPPTEQVGRDQTRVYRRDLAAGVSLQVTLTPVWGDPDLYVWPPDWEEGRPPWVSNLSGTEVDEIAFTTPVSGVYQIEVYGYTSAEYQLDIVVGAATFDIQVAGGIDPDKEKRQAPAVALDSEPPRDIPQEEAGYSLYLPLVMR